MADLSPTQELLADLGRQIAEEEIKVRGRIDRISEYDDPDVEDTIREEWHQFHLRIRPMLEQREYVIKQIVTIEACKPLPVMILPRS
jgi:hypothetical protein